MTIIKTGAPSASTTTPAGVSTTTDKLQKLNQNLQDVSRRISVFTAIVDDDIMMLPHMDSERMERLLELNEVIRQQAAAVEACIKLLADAQEQIGGAA